METKKTKFIVEALLMDYDTGKMTYQPISQPFNSYRQAKQRSFYDHFDHPTARVAPIS